jgi:hypothetical protein
VERREEVDKRVSLNQVDQLLEASPRPGLLALHKPRAMASANSS